MRGRGTPLPYTNLWYNRLGMHGLHFGRTFCNSLAVLALTILREGDWSEGLERVSDWFGRFAGCLKSRKGVKRRRR